MIEKMLEKIKSGLSSLKTFALSQERISQMQPGDLNNKFACLFTCYYMFLRHVCGYKKSWHDYKAACVKAGALREDFYVLDHQKMLSAANVDTYRPKKIVSNLVESIVTSVVNGRPVICSLNGEHWVSIDGWQIVGNEMQFTIDDPGYSGEWLCTWELKPFQIVNGKRKYQLSKKTNQPRTITSILVMERT